MKLATLPSTVKNNRDGQLVIVSKDATKAVKPPAGMPQTLLSALQSWDESVKGLTQVYNDLNAGKAAGSFALDLEKCLAPLPNAPGFYDGSAFLSHVVRARKARGDQMPESARITPLMYQGVSDCLMPATSPLEIMDEKFGGDFEGEFAVVMKDTPKGISADKAENYIALFTMFNDITLREIVKTEIETKFGFLQSKPNSSFAPIMVTPDELGAAWKQGRVHLNLEVWFNNKRFGSPHGSEMNFTFGQLIAHAGRTRPLSAGSIVGTGTISNEDKENGFACLTEKRFQEILDGGKPVTPWLKPGDTVKIDVTMNGASVFGPIAQTVVL